jgi:hypothetical protein
MSNKETTVSWLISELTEYGLMHKDILPSHPIFKKAKEMEKQQIIDAWYDGEAHWDSGKNGNEYYKETYGGQNHE